MEDQDLKKVFKAKELDDIFSGKKYRKGIKSIVQRVLK